MNIHESAEDYLEKILMLQEQKGSVRSGMEIAQRIYGRHRKLTAFFVALGVDPDVAAKDACKVEHDLSEETYSKMIAFAEKAEKEL